jgi:hypothetical protein
MGAAEEYIVRYQVNRERMFSVRRPWWPGWENDHGNRTRANYTSQAFPPAAYALLQLLPSAVRMLPVQAEQINDSPKTNEISIKHTPRNYQAFPGSQYALPTDDLERQRQVFDSLQDTYLKGLGCYSSIRT